MPLALIAAVARNRVIGFQGKMPWQLPRDLEFFHAKTEGHFVVVGRTTFQNLPAQVWQDKKVIVLTRDPKFQPPEGVLVAHSQTEVFKMIESKEESFVIGGAKVYKEFLPLADALYITEVDAEVEGDAFFPEFDLTNWREVSREQHEKDAENSHDFDFIKYEAKG